MINRKLLNTIENEEDEEQLSPIARLIETGHHKGYVTQSEILDIFPDVEDDLEQLDEIFAALISAGISFNGDAPHPEEEEKEAEPEAPPKKKVTGIDHLANIDIDDSVGLYIKEVSQVPLLTHQEELELAQRIEQGRMAREELARGNGSKDRRSELRMMIEDGWAAREHLIKANSRLVISVAKKYMGRGVPFLDLIQEGNIGLMRAAKKFDYHRGYKFSTYATWWIRQAVTRATADQGRTIRVPVHMGDQISRMLRIQHSLKQKLSRDPSIEEVAEALQVEPAKVEQMIQAARHPYSLQMPVGDEDDNVLGDFIEDENTPTPDDTATDNILREHLQDILEQLPPREARILQLRYGLKDGKVLTLNEVGQLMGVTRERVRQIESQALRRLRSPLIQHELRPFLD
jgi:RNA polymerase primary sigma factor